MNSIKGTIDAILDQQEIMRIPEKYKYIHSAYTTLNENQEALKRAIFIQWYAASEPAFLTGIISLGKENEISNILKLNDYISNNKIDKEFQAMICYYYSISDWYFNSFSNISSLLDFLNTCIINKRHIQTEDRGVMGNYWEGIK